MSKKKKKLKRKLNYKRVIIVLIILFLLFLIIYGIFNIRIKNIYISGNNFLSDQEIIDISGLKDYPKSTDNLSSSIKNRLEKNTYISKVSVSKNILLNKVYINIKEDYPLFYYVPESKTVLFSGSKVDDKYSTPTVINQIPNTVFDKFIEKMQKVDIDILDRMSEIQYLPNDVDNERFFVLMNDGNYVYLTISKFLTINKYVDMIKSFNNKKGVLYLDSGEYFDIFDE